MAGDDFRSVLEFWFAELSESQWWAKDPELDQRIRRRFGELHRRAAMGELYAWRQQPQGRLAEIIILDQFSRNIYRDSAQAFACDGMALVLAQTALAVGDDRLLEPLQRNFLYLPYMHSESLLVHQQAEALFVASGIAKTLDFEYRHRAIIERFGRYPHRNALLGRSSSAEELAFLQQPGSSF